MGDGSDPIPMIVIVMLLGSTRQHIVSFGILSMSRLECDSNSSFLLRSDLELLQRISQLTIIIFKVTFHLYRHTVSQINFVLCVSVYAC